MPVTLVLGYPPAALSPNARVNRWRKASAVRDYRWACKVEAQSQMRERYPDVALPLAVPVLAWLEFVVTVRRTRDADNLMASCKACWDGLRDAGVLAADDEASLWPVFGGQVLSRVSGLRVTLWPAGEVKA